MKDEIITAWTKSLLPRELRQYTNRKLFVALGAIIFATFAATITAVFAISQLLVYRQNAQDHNDVRVQLEALLYDIDEAESAQRGYLLTNDEGYLVRYRAAVKQVPGHLKKIDELAQGASRPPAAALKPLVEQKLKELERSVQLHQGGDPAGAVSLVSGVGRVLKEQIRTANFKVQAEESKQLSKDGDAVLNLALLARNISIVSLLAILALAAMVYWIYLKAIQVERRLDRAKDEFVSLASHQLRTPATGIKSILATLVAGDFGTLNEKQTYFMKRALESNERELSIIEELLNVAKADAGRLILHATEVDVGQIITTVAEEQSAAIARKNLDLTVRRPGYPLRIMADEEKLYMAIGNLLDNARKYTPESGKLSISAFKRHGNQVGIEITDSGIGIDPEELSHIFDRFHRASEVMAGGVEGAGLGLYLASRIAELHEGTIEVSSRRGKGTKFVMILPQGELNAAEGSLSRG